MTGDTDIRYLAMRIVYISGTTISKHDFWFNGYKLFPGFVHGGIVNTVVYAVAMLAAFPAEHLSEAIRVVLPIAFVMQLWSMFVSQQQAQGVYLHKRFYLA